MILAYAIILLIALALIFRRDLSAIGNIRYRGGPLLIAIIIGLFVLQWGLIVYASGQNLLQMAILILTQLALLLLLILNRHVAGAKLFALGIALNTVVMVTNGGWMPVTPEMYNFVHPDREIEINTRPPSSKNVVLPQEETNLWILSDIVPVTLWRRWGISVGDLLLITGAAQFIFQTTSSKKKPTVNWSNTPHRTRSN